MAVRRIVANIAAADAAAAKRFYGDLLGLDVAMDFGWIVTYATDVQARVQVSIMNEGGRAHRCPIFPSRSMMSMSCWSAQSRWDFPSNMVRQMRNGVCVVSTRVTRTVGS